MRPTYADVVTRAIPSPGGRARTTPGGVARGAALLCTALLATACAASPSATLPPPGELPVGTWGGDGAGVIVVDTLAHVHIGCTLGDFPRPRGMSDGRFDVAGQYDLRAFPVSRGPNLPARLSGVVRGALLTLLVTVDDTVEKRRVVLGPMTIVQGREPRLGPCPICVMKPTSGASSAATTAAPP